MNYKRNLKQLKDIKNTGYKVFSCFSCGGGSSMGYKNAGFEVVGTCEIDPQMNKVYQANFGKGINYEMGVQEMKKLENIDESLFDIDILDGSPPCSTFSMVGAREKGWGVKKKFREGQEEQNLSDLFFDFIDLAARLQPKVIVAENVKGMLVGSAKLYVKEIARRFDEIGYNVQLFLLNGANMGLPQARERVFFIACKKSYNLPPIQLLYNEPPIFFKEISDENDQKQNLSDLYSKYWDVAKPGKPVGKFDATKKLAYNKVATTVTSAGNQYHPKYKRTINKLELCLMGSYPLDYNFMDVAPRYLIGMSVPPLMIYRISKAIQEQRLDIINNKTPKE